MKRDEERVSTVGQGCSVVLEEGWSCERSEAVNASSYIDVDRGVDAVDQHNQGLLLQVGR